MKVTLVLVTLCIGGALSSGEGENRIADAEFMKKQKMILRLYSGISHGVTYEKKQAEYDFVANADKWTDPTIPKRFSEAYPDEFLSKDAVFVHNMPQTILLFDLFYFAKDFETFYEVASWAKVNLNSDEFGFALGHAVAQRGDCQGVAVPPIYETLPSYYVPTDALHKAYDAKMVGLKEFTVSYNTTGYEHSDHSPMFGGPLAFDGYNPHLEYKISYFREDVGISNWYLGWILRNAHIVASEKYNKSISGEGFYFVHQQFLARYINERYANMLPNIEPLYWDKPIRVGYNPRVSFPNGVPLVARPDFYNPSHSPDPMLIEHAKAEEWKLFDTIEYGGYWNQVNNSFDDFEGKDMVEVLGTLMYTGGPHVAHKQSYYGPYFWIALEALASMVQTSNNRLSQFGALTTPLTALHDPLYYSFLIRLLTIVQMQKLRLPRYTVDELNFSGVSVKSFEVDKFVTFFDRFNFEVSNAFPVADMHEYKDMKYYAQSYRLNRKPFNYKITVESDAAHDGIVRVFLGPEYNSMEQELSLEQKRFAYYELDRFRVKISAGTNVFERSSEESPYFSPDPEGFRSLYLRANNESATVQEVSCGFPQRYQIPRGWRSGRKTSIVVVVSSIHNTVEEEDYQFYCIPAQLSDGRPDGFPFDRPVNPQAFAQAKNIRFANVPIFHLA